MKKQAITKRQALAGASGMALILGLVNVAVAQTTIQVTNPVVSVGDIKIVSTASHLVQESQYHRAANSSKVISSPYTAPNATGTVTLDNNIISARAAGNETVDAGLINVLSGTQDLSFAMGQYVDGSSGNVITATIDTPLVTVNFTGPVVAATVSDTDAAATVIMNRSEADIEHSGLSAFDTPNALGSGSGHQIHTKQVQADANVVMANYQQTKDARGTGDNSTAQVKGGGINVTVDAGATFGAGATIAVADNDIHAGFQANDTRNRYAAESLDFDGSAVIASYQENTSSTNTGDPSASVTGSGIAVDVGSVIDGAVDVARNTIGASARGNTANHALQVEALRVVGDSAGSGAQASGSSGGPGRASVADVNLGIANVQLNTNVLMNSAVSGSNITVTGTGGAGNISVVANAIEATAGGSEAASTITATAGSFDLAAAAISNTQRNIDTLVHADTVGAIIVSGALAPSPLGDQTGAVVLSDNGVRAAARGSSASNTIQLDNGGTLATSDASSFALSNLQRSQGNGEVVANASGNIAAILDGNTGVPTVATVADNAVDALAVTHAADNEVILGLSGSYVGSIHNGQVVHAGNNTVATTNTPASSRIGIVLADGDGNTGDDLAVSDNRIRATAGGNSAANVIAGTAHAGITVNPDGIKITSVQTANGDVTAVTNGMVGILASGTLGGDSAVLDNAVVSVAFGNDADNRLSLVAGTRLDMNDGSAVIDNTQNTAGDITATTIGKVIISGNDPAFVPPGLAIAGMTTLKGNAVTAYAMQNQAGNALALEGKAGSVDGSAGVMNSQTASGDSTATVNTGSDGMSIFAIGDITGSTVVTENSLVAQAGANLAQNRLDAKALTDLELYNANASSGGAALDSGQTNSGAVTASTVITGVGVNATGSIAGTTVVSENTVLAQAHANEVDNRITLEARSGAITGSAGTLANQQTNGGAVISGAVNASLTVAQGVGINAETDVGGQASVVDNVLGSDAMANLAHNVVSASANGDIDTVTLDSAQENWAAVNSTFDLGGVGVTAGGDLLADAIASVSGNRMSSSAVANQADNAIALASIAGGVATDNKLNNEQSNVGAVSSTFNLNTVGGVGVNVGGTLLGLAVVNDNQLLSTAAGSLANNRIDVDALSTGGDATLSNTQTNGGTGTISSAMNLEQGVGIHAQGAIEGTVATVTDTVIDSLAVANHADNRIAQSGLAEGVINSTLDNTQDNAAGVNSTVDFGGFGSIGVSTQDKMTDTTVNIAGNDVAARAFGNSAANVLNASVSSGALTSAQASTNTQINSGAIVAAINGPNDSWAGRVFDVRTGGTGSGNTLNIAGNNVTALAYGNTAFNQLTASALLGAASASQSLISAQTNTGNVTASVTNAGMGVMGAGTGNRTIIAGNSISATAVGNASVSTMVIGN